MRSPFFKRTIGILLLSFVFGFGTPLAQVQSGVDYGVDVSRKFGRGLVNLLSSPAEIPCTMRDDYSERGGTGLATGFFKGIFFFMRRALVGATEIGTFMIPMEATIPAVCARHPEARVES